MVAKSYLPGGIHKPTLWGSPQIRLADIGDPQLGRMLRTRYKKFVREISPQALRCIKRLPRKCWVHAMTISGSAVSFREFHRIALNVFLDDPAEGIFLRHFTFLNPDGKQIYKTARMSFMNIRHLGPQQYIRYLYASPLIFGKKPEYFKPYVPGLLCDAARDMAKDFDQLIRSSDKVTYRRLAQLLMHSAVYQFAFYDKIGRMLPDDFPEAMRKLYGMDADAKYNIQDLLRIREQLSEWQENFLDLCAEWARRQQKRPQKA